MKFFAIVLHFKYIFSYIHVSIIIYHISIRRKCVIKICNFWIICKRKQYNDVSCDDKNFIYKCDKCRNSGTSDMRERIDALSWYFFAIILLIFTFCLSKTSPAKERITERCNNNNLYIKYIRLKSNYFKGYAGGNYNNRNIWFLKGKSCPVIGSFEGGREQG